MSVGVLALRLQSAVTGAFPEPLWVAGEVQDAKQHPTGHVYFTLKDETGSAAVDAVIYKINVAPRVRELVKNGARVVVLAKVVYYAPRGRLQISVERVQVQGRGALLEAIEKLKEKLQGEGLFDPARKRPLPEDPRVVGVVTSAKGAAIHDIAREAERRGGARLLLCPATVQGSNAARTIVRALWMLTRVPEVDVIIVGRGGGSTDDLIAYNDEELVRAVAASRVPIVSAVGHDIDITLVDFAADKRAATPSQAAAMVVPDRAARRHSLAQYEARLRRAIKSHVVHERARLSELGKRLGALHPGAVLTEQGARMSAAEQRLESAIRARLERERARLERDDARARAAMKTRLAAAQASLGRSAARLDAMSPLAVLGRGYAIATKDGRAIVAAEEVHAGDAIEVRVHEGRFEAEVKRVIGGG